MAETTNGKAPVAPLPNDCIAWPTNYNSLTKPPGKPRFPVYSYALDISVILTPHFGHIDPPVQH
jgi:hypothetical protein